MQIANAVAEARLRAAAELIALGCPPVMITWYTSRTPGGNCGLTVAGHLAWEAHVEWDGGEAATIDTWWCGSFASAHDWVPSDEVQAWWVKNGDFRTPWMGPNL